MDFLFTEWHFQKRKGKVKRDKLQFYWFNKDCKDRKGEEWVQRVKTCSEHQNMDNVLILLLVIPDQDPARVGSLGSAP